MYYIKNIKNNCYYCQRQTLAQIKKVYLEMIKKGYKDITITYNKGA